jgi:hypothetical protein
VGRGRRPVPVPLAVAAVVTVLAAVLLDIKAAEHPTHTVIVGLAAAVVAVVRLRLAGRFDDVLAAISGAIVAQPALHATAGADNPGLGAGLHGPLHVVASDGPKGLVQVAVPTLVVLVVVFCSRLVALLLGAMPRRTGRPSASLVDPRRPTRPAVVRTARLGSMVRWCGWALQTARRGPPPPLRAHLFSPPSGVPTLV